MQAVAPEDLVLLDPVDQRHQTAGHGAVVDVAACVPIAHQARATECREVLRDGRLGDRGARGELRNGRFALAGETLKDGAARGIGQSPEDIGGSALAEGDWVAVRWTMHGRHTGAFAHPTLGSAPPSGNQVSVTYRDQYRIVGGQIAEVWEVRDGLALVQQLGIVPTSSRSPA